MRIAQRLHPIIRQEPPTPPASSTGMSPTDAFRNVFGGMFAGSASPGTPAPAIPTKPPVKTPVETTPPTTLEGRRDQASSTLNDALKRAGIDPSRVQLNYRENLCYFPGSNYTDREIDVTGADGKTLITTNVDLMLRSPDLAAFEIQRALKS